MITEFTDIQDQKVKVLSCLILGDNGKFYQAAHFEGIEGFRLCSYSINEKDAYKKMREISKAIIETTPEEKRDE